MDGTADDKTLLIMSGGMVPQIENCVGCLKAIQDVRDVRFDEVMATSAGAIVGAMFMSYDQDIATFERLIKRTPMSDWFEFCPWQAIKSILGKSNCVYDNTGLKKFLDQYITDDARECVKVAVSEMTADAKFVAPHTVDGRSSHVLASMSFQHVFPPVKWNDKYFGDGGVNDNIPTPKYTDLAKYKHIYMILAPSAQLLPSVSKFPFVDQLFNLIDNTMNRELAQIEQFHLEEARNITVLKPSKWVDSAGFLSWSNNFEQIDASYKYAKQVLETESKEKRSDGLVQPELF